MHPGTVSPVAPQRDHRRFGPGPYLRGLRVVGELPGEHPFDLPVVRRIETMALDQPVTMLAGENGAGKSTLVEMLAEIIGFGAQGGELERSGQLPPVPRPVSIRDAEGRAVPVLEPVLSMTRPRGGYFLRAESFFNVAAYVGSDDDHAPDISLYGGVGLHEQSHGQSFLALAANRFGANGLYLLDEPEAALSVTSLLALLSIIQIAAAEGAQFIIATHSPILLACPAARIYELDDEGLTARRYDDVGAVQLTRAFLDAPDRYLRALLDDDD
jgi:predicted ATPase